MKEHNYYLIHNLIPLNYKLIRGELTIINYFKYSYNLIKVFLYEIWYEYFIFGVRTSSIIELDSLSLDSDHIKEGKHYRPTHYYILYKIFNELNTMVDFNKSILLDYGSGMGRVLLFGLNKGISHVIGVEFAKELCIISEENILKALNVNTYKIFNIDAANYTFDREINIVFLFQPFSENIFYMVMNKINESKKLLYFISIFDRYSTILIDNGFQRISDYKVNTRIEYVIWKRKSIY